MSTQVDVPTMSRKRVPRVCQPVLRRFTSDGRAQRPYADTTPGVYERGFATRAVKGRLPTVDYYVALSRLLGLDAQVAQQPIGSRRISAVRAKHASQSEAAHLSLVNIADPRPRTFLLLTRQTSTSQQQ